MPTTSVQPRPRWHNLLVADMNIDENAVLRLRICGHAACRAAFTICVRCDRGQRYCSPKCRSEVRQRQRHDANRRYQQSEPGGECHCRCQKCYRERALRTPVKIMVRWQSLRRHLPRRRLFASARFASTQPLDRSISGLQKSVWIRCPSHSPTDTSAIVQTGCID